MSTSGHSRRTSGSVGSRSNYRSTTPSKPPPQLQVTPDVAVPAFQPCASTSSMFLYAQGKSITCLHHDSLATERRFEKHKEKVVLLAVDTVSERGQRRLVVSYDAEQTAIVWDLYTGDELARFSSFEPFTNASWMKNGNICFGSAQGNVVIFEPSTTEHKSRRTIFDPITSIAPASDCTTYAIGYHNGSVLIASLEPQFTILHTLSTSRAPSPVAALAWHASSSKQRSDMLAIQMADGDLRVWSVAKSTSTEAPKVIRVLKRGDDVDNGRNWISWSKNGRVLQYSQGETWSWDVRTKHVAYEQVPTVEEVRGISNYGPNAVLFTLGPEGSVQQYELNPPSLMRAVQPEVDECASAQNTPKINPSHIIGAAPPVPIYNAMDPSRPGAHSLQTIKEATSQSAIDHAQMMRNGITSPVSTSSRAESVSSRSSGGTGNYRDRAPSVSSRAPSGTVFSAFSTPMIPRESVASPFWASASVASSGRRSRGSRLKNEVLRSPEAPMVDLFPFTRQRLASLPYAPQTAALDQNTASAGDLRRQMLHIVFGWEGDIDELIRGEMNKHPQGSTNAALLGKWLGETNLDSMSMMMSNSVSSTDWMLLALSNMNGNGDTGKEMGRALAQKHINQGDIHTAATIYVGIEELEEAVDIYVSRNYFMEGILLTALLFPNEWQRQAHLVRRWGEYVVENSQQHLAIRCFTCTGADNSVPWASPGQSPFTSSNPGISIGSMISPPTSPDGPSKAQIMTAKNPSLRLITSFGGEKPQYKFPGLRTDDGTPTMAPGITPIADSALSPGGTPGGVRLPRGASLLGKGSGNHSRLPSIGETPINSNPPLLPIPNTVKRLPTPENSGSDREKEPDRERKAILPSLHLQTQDLGKKNDDAPLLLSATVYNPNEEDTPMPHGTPQTALKGTPQTAHPTTAQKVSHSEGYARNRLAETSRTRNGSRDRKPNGLQIQMPSLNQVNLPQLTAGSDQSGHFRGRNSESSSMHSGSSASGKFPLRDRLRDFESGGEPSAPLTGKSWASSTKSPSVTARSMNQYISSLEAANWDAKQKKQAIKLSRSKERKSKVRDAEEATSARGRTSMRYIQPPKRSPSSPVPMSPEDLQQYRDAHSQSIDSHLNLNMTESSTDEQQKRAQKPRDASKGRSVSKFSGTSYRTAVREVSPDARVRRASRKGRSRQGSRLTSPERLLSPIEARGRSTSKGPGSHARSPSSPLPFSPQAELYREQASPDPLRLVAENKARLRSRQSSRQRSTSRVPRERGSTRSRARREPSQDRRISERYGHAPQLSESSIPQSPEKRRSDPPHSDSSPGFKPAKSIRTIKKEQAARELEARRVSLIAHSQQTLVHPSELSARPPMPDRSMSDHINAGESKRGQWTPPGDVSSGMLREGAPNPHERSASTGPLLGLPATPRAMKHPKYQAHNDVPAMPAIPDQFYATGQPKFEPSRSMSAPVPEPGNGNDSGIHPAYQRNIRPSAMANRRPSFQPLHEIGRPRQGSIDAGNGQHMGSIDGALQPIIEGEGDHGVIIVPETRTPGHSTPTPTPPPFVLPQLAHLAFGGVNNHNNNDSIPPPPPPPPPPPFAGNIAHHSLSSGSGVGTINILMDEGETHSPSGMNAVAMAHATAVLNLTLPSSSYAPPRGESLSRGAQRGESVSRNAQRGVASNGVVDHKPLPPSPSAPGQTQNQMHGPRSHTHTSSNAGPRSPPAAQIADPMESIRAGAASPPQTANNNTGGGHRRGRSIDRIGSKTMRVFERMRSNSRGRNENAIREREKKTKSPKLLTEGFGEGITSGLNAGQRAPYETAGTYF